MIDRVKELLAVEEQIERVESDLKGLKERAEKLDEEVQSLFCEHGIQNIGVGGKTVYMSRQTWTSVRPERKEEARKVLEALGLGDFVKESVSGQQLSAWVRERIDQNETIPPELQECIRVTEKLSIRVRKGN